MTLSQFPLPATPPAAALRLWLLITLCSAAAAALLLPRRQPFPYTYAAGQPWGHRTLLAPFDFEVLYPEQQVQADVQRVQAEHAPYFGLSAEIGRQQKRQFLRLLEEQARISQHDAQYDDLNRNLSAYARFGQSLLDHIYAQGIADPDEATLRENPGFVYIVAGREERRVPLAEIWTLRSAQRFLSDTLPFSDLRQPEYLLPMLEKSLAPNLIYSDSLTLVSKRHKLAAVRSTGVSVRKGETLVQRGELVGPDTVQKLDSLARRYEAAPGPEVLAGYLLLALLAYGFFYGWLGLRHPQAFRQTGLAEMRPLLVMGGISLALVAALRLCTHIGMAVPLLLPLYALPLVIRLRGGGQQLGVRGGMALWLLVVVVSAIALDWGLAWAVIQLAGLAGALLWPSTQGDWRLRGASTLFTLLLQVAAWLGIGLAGRLPDSLWTADVPLFLLVAAVLSWLLHTLRL